MYVQKNVLGNKTSDCVTEKIYYYLMNVNTIKKRWMDMWLKLCSEKWWSLSYGRSINADQEKSESFWYISTNIGKSKFTDSNT
jgi:hypothetical protein